MPKRRRHHHLLDEENLPQTRPAPAAAPADRTGLMALQRQVGNRAVQRALAEQLHPERLPMERRTLARQTETGEVESALDNRYSGHHWAVKYPAKTDIGDLDSGFAHKVQLFVERLQAAGASVDVKETTWPAERVYLMHWAWKIAKQGYDPRRVPPFAKVGILWWHGDLQRSRQAAMEMVEGFEIDELEKALPLNTPHKDGKAIDMQISWSKELAIKDAGGKLHVISASPGDGTNPKLIAVARSFGLAAGPGGSGEHEDHWAAVGA